MTKGAAVATFQVLFKSEKIIFYQTGYGKIRQLGDLHSERVPKCNIPGGATNCNYIGLAALCRPSRPPKYGNRTKSGRYQMKAEAKAHIICVHCTRGVAIHTRGMQSGAKTYYYRADFLGFFCCPTFWIFWEGNLKFQKLKSYFRLHLGPNICLSMVFGMGGAKN